jgi:hypothetical protein
MPPPCDIDPALPAIDEWVFDARLVLEEATAVPPVEPDLLG